ncbi:MAG: hypothetical protein AB7P17_10025 [Nitrospirales bacterium]
MGKTGKILFALIIVLPLLFAVYIWSMLTWSYSTGERAGWVQKLSKKGWLCKTWEGDLAMVAMPGSTPEMFYFTVHDEEVVDRINQAMGKRVSLVYQQHVGLPTTCFGMTQHFVTDVRVVE